MNWIFTVIFSGLLMSGSQGTAVERTGSLPESRPATFLFQDETERFEQTYPLSAGGRVSASNINGSIVVEAWDRSEVKVTAIKTADTKERLQEVEIRVTAKPDSVSIETNYDNWKQNGSGERWRNGSRLKVDYHLMVPRGAVLNEIETVNGDVTVSDFTNLVKISAVNGTVMATKLRGTANLSTVNGEVTADFGSLDAGTKISLSTVNGKVNLTLPSDANATVKADSLNGSIANDFGLPVRKGKYIGRDLYGKLGNGDARVKLDSVNGSLKISRINDGKTPGVVTDLLPKKANDDEDWDPDDKDQSVDRVKIKKDVAKAVKESKKQAVVAVTQAQKEISMAQPEINRTVTESAKVASDAVRQSLNVITSENIQQAVEAGMLKQKAVMAKLADAMYFPATPRSERKTDTFPVSGVPKVTVQTHHCSVKITGWDRSEVKYVLSRSSSSRNQSSLEIKESHDPTSVTLTADGSDDSGRTVLEIFVPRKANLKVTTDSELRLDGVSGEIDLTGKEESVNVRDVDGRLSVTTSGGRVRVVGFKGEIQTSSAGGMTMLEGDFSKLTARAEDGNIIVTLPENAAASITAVSPSTTVDGLKAETVKESEGTREYRLGAGGPKVNITTGGDIVLRSPETIVSKF